MKKPKHQKKLCVFVAGVLILLSCQSTPCSKAYLSPLPEQKEFPSEKENPQEYLKVLKANYIKALK